MASWLGRFSNRLLFAHELRRWRRMVAQAPGLDLASLRAQRGQARELRRQLDRLIHLADGRLLATGAQAALPLHTEWDWRPEICSGPLAVPGLSGVQNKAVLGQELRIFHDCPLGEINLRQIRNNRDQGPSPFGLQAEVFGFDGSFLSLVIDLPDSAVAGLTRRHLVQFAATVECERPMTIFARLNIRHGPNTEQITRELDPGLRDIAVDFDLAYSRLNEKRVERMWLDLILDDPRMNRITLRDVTLSRRPRAEL